MAELINSDNYQDFTLEMLKTPDGITKLNSILRQLSQNIAGDTESVRIYQGVGTPEGSVAAGVGSLYMRTDGGADTSVYRKESGSGDTGWVAIKAPASLPLSVANGGTGSDLSSTAQGSILYFSATGVISVLAPGTSGQALTTQGAAANPIYSTMGLKLVSVTTTSNAANTGDISISSTKAYLVKTVFTNKNTTSATNVWLRFNNSSTANKYAYVYRGDDIAATVRTGNSNYAETKIVCGGTYNSGTTQEFFSMDFVISPQATSGRKELSVQGVTWGNSAGTFGTTACDRWMGSWSESTTVTSFRLLYADGDTFTATTYLYEYGLA